MVRFSDLKKERKDVDPTSSVPPAEEMDAAAAFAEYESEATGEARRSEPAGDVDAVYQEAAFYLEKVFAAVKAHERFSLDPGFRIIRQVVEFPAAPDTLFVRSIQRDDPRNYLIQKSIHVAIYAVRLAEKLGYSRQKQVEIGMAGLLHEVGMCRIPEKILYKTEQLTRKEFEIIQQHSEFGLAVLEPYSDSHPYLAEVALQLHERIDGSGYPKGLTGEEIHEFAQIVGLADIYEALTHSRPQRDRFHHFYAIKEIIRTCKRKFRKKHLKALIYAFSIFPLSTYVRLNSNAVGQVIDTYPDQPMRPKLQIEYDSQGRKVLTERVVNLPENSLLYIVDSVTKEEIDQLERGVPLQETPAAFEERVVEPSSTPGARDEPEPSEGETAPSEPAPEKKGRAGSRPLVGLLLLLLVLGGLPLWQQKESGSRFSVRNITPASAARTEVPPAAQAHKVPAAASEAKQPADPEKVRPGRSAVFQKRITEPPAASGIPREAVPPKAKDAAGVVEAAARDLATPPKPNDRKTGPLPSIIEDRHAKKGGLPPVVSAVPKAESPIPGRLPYSLLLGSFRSFSQTSRAMSIYRDQGLTPYFAKVDLDENGIWYRVFSGCYASEAEAAAAALSLPLEDVRVKNTRYANLVAPGLSAPEAAASGQRLRALGFCPYSTGTGERVDLFVGAFLTKRGAEDQYAELLGKGVQNRIVER